MAVLQRKFLVGNGNTQEYLCVTTNFRHGTNEKVCLIPVISDANKVSINNNNVICLPPPKKTDFEQCYVFRRISHLVHRGVGMGVQDGIYHSLHKNLQ